MSVDLILWLELAAFVILMGLSAFFSSSETGLFSLDRIQLDQMRRNGHPRIDLIERMLSQPRRLIVTILIGNELVNVAASVISAAFVIRVLGAESKWINLLIMVPVLLLVGEITPKTLAIRNNVAFAAFQSRFIDLFARAITPLRWAVRRVADYFITLIVGKERSPANIITEDMVRSLAREAVGKGTLDSVEAQYINQIFDFGDKTLSEVMTPRSQVFFLPATMPLAEMAAEIHRTRHTKVPVCEDDGDTVVGVLFARDMLGMDLDRRIPDVSREARIRFLRKFLRKAYFVPESRSVSDLFHTFRNRKLSVALTVDEYGGVTGLVTMEDLLECIFGEIPSPSEQIKERQVDFEELGGGHYRIDGSMTITQFNRLAGADLTDGDADTVGGMLLHRFGELPPKGTRMVIGDYEFKVASADNQRISEVVVRPASEADSAPPGEE